MASLIAIKSNKSVIFEVDRKVFFMLFNHTIARRNPKFDAALVSKSVKLDDFLVMSRAGEVPYPLFFLDRIKVKTIISDYEKKVYFGVSKKQISIATRGDIELADISLIIKDITRKQGYIRGHIDETSTMAGMFKRSRKTIQNKAEIVRQVLGYNIQDIEGLNKEKTFDHLSKLLANINIFVSLYTDHYTPLSTSGFSGHLVSSPDKRRGVSRWTHLEG